MSENPGSRNHRRFLWTGLLLLMMCLLGGAAGLMLRRARADRSAHRPEIRLESAGGHRLLVDGVPFLIRGVCYNPVPVGANYEHDLWNPNSPMLAVDGPLLADLNANTIRIYHPGKDPAAMKRMIGGMYQRHRVFTLLGHHLGFWQWPPVNYALAADRDRVKADVLEMVRTYRDEPGILAWVLGNENNYSFDMDELPWTTRCWSTAEIDALPDEEAGRLERARIYYSFVNDVALEIKKIDRRPVIMAFGETRSLESAARYAPDVDILGLNVYRGPSFGNLFREIGRITRKPVVLLEFGCDRFNVVSQREDQNVQAEFIKSQWRDILKNTPAMGGARNCLGGTICEWSDEWWKGNESSPAGWRVQDGAGQWWNPAYYYDTDARGLHNINEEWWGIVRLDPSRREQGLDARVPTKAYFLLQSMWKSSDR